MQSLEEKVEAWVARRAEVAALLSRRVYLFQHCKNRQLPTKLEFLVGDELHVSCTEPGHPGPGVCENCAAAMALHKVIVKARRRAGRAAGVLTEWAKKRAKERA